MTGNISVPSVNLPSSSVSSVDVSLSGNTLTVNVDGKSDSVSLSSIADPLKGTITFTRDSTLISLYLESEWPRSGTTGSGMRVQKVQGSGEFINASLSGNVKMDSISLTRLELGGVQNGQFSFFSYAGTQYINPNLSGISFEGEGSGTLTLSGFALAIVYHDTTSYDVYCAETNGTLPTYDLKIDIAGGYIQKVYMKVTQDNMTNIYSTYAETINRIKFGASTNISATIS